MGTRDHLYGGDFADTGRRRSADIGRGLDSGDVALDEAAITRQRSSASWLIPEGPHVRPARAGLRMIIEPDLA